MANWTTCPQCNYLIVDPSQPCPSCGAAVPASAMPAKHPGVNNAAPALSGNISNITMWILAFMPLVGRLIERFLLNGKYGDASGLVGIFTMAFNKYEFWYVTFALILIAGCLDLAVLKKAGHDLGKYVWLVVWLAWVFLSRDWITVASISPIYIFQRARDSGQSLVCFVVSIVTFIAPIVIGYV